MVGEGVAQHVRRLRLERAAFRLIHTDEPVTRIALDARYEAHESFTRAFRKTFQTSPRSSAHGIGTRGASVRTRCTTPRTAPRSTGRRRPRRPNPERIVEHPARDAWAIRHVGPYLDSVGLWAELAHWTAEAGWDLRAVGAGICYDDPAITRGGNNCATTPACCYRTAQPRNRVPT